MSGQAKINVWNGLNFITGITTASIISDMISSTDGFIYVGSGSNLYKIDPNSYSIVSTLTINGTSKITECNGKLLCVGGVYWDIVSMSSFTKISGGTFSISGSSFYDSCAVGTKCYATSCLTYNTIKVFDMVNNTISPINNYITFPAYNIDSDLINNRVCVSSYLGYGTLPAIPYPTIIFKTTDLS